MKNNATKKREIDVDIFTTERELVIHLYNTFLPDTIKYDDDELVHGYGTANVFNITHNRGNYNFYQRKFYHAVVTIPCNIDKYKKYNLILFKDWYKNSNSSAIKDNWQYNELVHCIVKYFYGRIAFHFLHLILPIIISAIYIFKYIWLKSYKFY